MTSLKRVPDAHYENPKLAQIYDDFSGWSVDRDFYLALAGNVPIRVLDLGCGTGLICDAYAAKNHQVTGVDPAASMLEVARGKPHGHKVEWIQSEAQNYFSENKYDLIIMTGHAFQVLLEEVDVRAVFSVMKKHLAPGGRIVFESRNPNINWASRWNTESKLNLQNGPVREERRVTKVSGNRIHFEVHYHFRDETLISRSELRFWNQKEIDALLAISNLRCEALYGDWDQSAFDLDVSEEMIFVVKALS